MKALYTLLLSASICILTAGCSLPDKDTQKITAHPGHDFTIEIESNPTTGYLWIRTDKCANIESLGMEFIPLADTEPCFTGTPSTQKMTFKTLAKGTDTLVFEYKRPWEKSAPEKTHKVIVKTK